MKATVYLHASKETMWDLGEKLGLEGEALLYFRHALTEVEIELEVERDGNARIISVDKRKLEQ